MTTPAAFPPQAWGVSQPATEEPARYTNAANVASSQWDVTIDFLLTSQATGSTAENPQIQQHRVAQVVMSPMHAKALTALLSAAVGQWEQKFGSLPDVEKLLPNVPQVQASGTLGEGNNA